MSAQGRALAQRMIDAHGGMARWERAASIDFDMSGGGLLLLSKGQRGTMDAVRVSVATTGQRTVIAPYPGPGRRGTFDTGSVLIEDEGGRVVERRDDPRPRFRGLRRQLRWEALDLLYFAGYALWNYVSVPFVLLREGYELDADAGNVLRVTFPPDVHTHCQTQRFVLDDGGRLRRHLYTAEPVGPWARSVHVAAGHRRFDGLEFPTRRRVYPRGPFGFRIPSPPLVRIDADNFCVQ
jgi:hypothetical protein